MKLSFESKKQAEFSEDHEENESEFGYVEKDYVETAMLDEDAQDGNSFFMKNELDPQSNISNPSTIVIREKDSIDNNTISGLRKLNIPVDGQVVCDIDQTEEAIVTSVRSEPVNDVDFGDLEQLGAFYSKKEMSCIF